MMTFYCSQLLTYINASRQASSGICSTACHSTMCVNPGNKQAQNEGSLIVAKLQALQPPKHALAAAPRSWECGYAAIGDGQLSKYRERTVHSCR